MHALNKNLQAFCSTFRSQPSAMWKRAVLILSAWMLTGCASYSAIGNVPGHLLIPCPDTLPMPRDGSASSLIENDAAVAVAYYKCRSRDLAKIRIIQNAMGKAGE